MAKTRLENLKFLAKVYGWHEVLHSPSSFLISYRRDGVRLNIYYSRMTVGTAMKHPTLGHTQLFRKDVDMGLVDEFLRESNAIEGVYDEVSFTQARRAWEYLMKQDVLTLVVILKTHKILMLHSNLQPNEKGYIRTVDVWVGRHKGMTPALIASHLTMAFCFETMRVSPPPDWQALHVKYEQIHPFVDGNGRTGRMFMNWTRVRRCNLPILTIYADERQAYYDWFRV